MYKAQSFRLSVDEHVTSAGQQILCVLERQHRYYASERVRAFVGRRLRAAARGLCDLFAREMDDLHGLLQQHYGTLLLLDLIRTQEEEEQVSPAEDRSMEFSPQAKESSPVPARSLSVKQEPEDHLYLNMVNLPKEEVEEAVCPERQLRSPSPSPSPSPVRAEDTEDTLQRREEAGGSLPAVKSERGDSHTDLLEGLLTGASATRGHPQPQAIEDDRGPPPGDEDQLLRTSHPSYESDAEYSREYSGEWEETGEDPSTIQRYPSWSNEVSQDVPISTEPPSMRGNGGGGGAGEMPVSCAVCGKLFAFGGYLIRHMRTHTGQTQPAERVFNCPVCGKSFNRTGNLKTHMRIHTGEKPFGCAVCGKRFTLKCHLKIHMRIHTGEKPFTCTVCCKGFGQKSGLERHMRIHMGGEFL